MQYELVRILGTRFYRQQCGKMASTPEILHFYEQLTVLSYVLCNKAATVPPKYGMDASKPTILTWY
jgi:hypothetical protein